MRKQTQERKLKCLFLFYDVLGLEVAVESKIRCDALKQHAAGCIIHSCSLHAPVFGACATSMHYCAQAHRSVSTCRPAACHSSLTGIGPWPDQTSKPRLAKVAATHAVTQRQL